MTNMHTTGTIVMQLVLGLASARMTHARTKKQDVLQVECFSAANKDSEKQKMFRCQYRRNDKIHGVLLVSLSSGSRVGSIARLIGVPNITMN